MRRSTLLITGIQFHTQRWAGGQLLTTGILTRNLASRGSLPPVRNISFLSRHEIFHRSTWSWLFMRLERFTLQTCSWLLCLQMALLLGKSWMLTLQHCFGSVLLLELVLNVLLVEGWPSCLRKRGGMSASL